MKIYITDEMIIDTEQISCFKAFKKTKSDFELIAFCGGNPMVLKYYNDLEIAQNDLNNIMCHLFIGTNFFDLNKCVAYNYSDLGVNNE